MFSSDVFESNMNFTIEEASGDVDGKHILGKIKGVFFVPNGVSRNNRYYPKELWEKQLAKPDIQKRMAERRMFGTISHTQSIDDVALLEGKISHIITSLNIVNGQGMGEALIIDTPAGKVLNTLLRAGSKLFVSSRANGAFKGEENGVPRVDPDSYELAGFDVVIDPGFMQANPKLVESIQKILEETKSSKENDLNLKNSEEDFNMKEVLESISKENATLKVTVESITKDLTTVKNENTVLADENSHLKAKFSGMESQIAEMSAKIKKYEVLGKPEEIDQALDVTDAKLKKYEALGTVESLTETLTKSKKLLEGYSAIGTPEKINEALDKAIAVMKSIAHLGSPAEIDEALESGINTINAYKEFGSVEDLKVLFEKLEKNAAQIKESRDAKKITDLAATLKVSEDKIKAVWGKLSEQEIKDLFAQPAPAAPVVENKNKQENKKIAEKFTKKETTPAATPKTEDKRVMFTQSRGAKLMEEFSK